MFRALILAGSLFLGAATPFTERTRTDFDTFLQLLNPYGKWTKLEQAWLYEPFEAYVPMTDGKWIYTDFGWYWLGSRPFSWATDHYGWWILGADNVWRWKPDPNWQPAKVEWRGTPEYAGWRPTPINRFGEFTESEATRYLRPEEWIFLPRPKLTQAITAADVVTGEKAKPILDKSETVNHTYVSWREIDRNGPDPFDTYGVAKSFMAEQTMKAAAKMVDISGGGDDASPIIVQAPAATATAPAAATDKAAKPPIYTIYSLPNYYYEVKASAQKPLDLYVYRPEIFQDSEGIQRRIDVWHNPKVREVNREKVNRVLDHGTLIIDGKGPATDSAPAETSTTEPAPATSPSSDTTSSQPATDPAPAPLRSKP